MQKFDAIALVNLLCILKVLNGLYSSQAIIQFHFEQMEVLIGQE